MEITSPEPGLVISYAYLWRNEWASGQDEGRKNRPCVIVISVEDTEGGKRVTVVPLTHPKPHDSQSAIEIPLAVKKHLGLDDENSWAILNEVNQFNWPGFDLRPLPKDSDKMAYGHLPPRLFQNLRNALLGLLVKKQAQIIHRD